MKKLSTLLTIIVILFLSIGAIAQTNAVSVANLTGHWKFAGKASAAVYIVQDSDFEYTFNANSTVTYKWGEVRPYSIKGNDIVITDKAGNLSYVHIEKIGNDEMTVITEYNTPSASTSIVFKKVK